MRVVNGTDDVEADKRRAEVFDALGHPTRIMILKALSEGPQGFADLKKKLGIDSSGHLQHHLGKLDGLVKTDDYGKYTLSDQGKDALVSVETVEKAAKSAPAQNGRGHIRKTTALKVAVVALALLLVVGSVLATVEYNQISSLQNSIKERDAVISQLNSTVDQLSGTIDQRDTLIMELDTALNLTQSRLSLSLPNGSQYLTTLPESNNQGNVTKIFLDSTAAWYHYGPSYPFDTPWFNGTGSSSFSSQRAFELTNNRSIPLSFWGWTIGENGNYSYGAVSGGGVGENPYLMIGVTVRNDYTSADAGNGSDPNAPIGNSTSRYSSIYHVTTPYVSFVNLSVKLISQDGSAIPADEPGIQSPTARGGQYFALGNGETKQVVFYLSPSSLNIGGFEIYVSYLSSVPQMSLP
jgi:DNA-binding HxlR family transcriptional regulator